MNVRHDSLPSMKSHPFEIAALIVDRPTHDLWTGWVARVEETGLCPPVRLPAAKYLLGACYRSVIRRKD